jgi:transposase
MSSMKPPIYVRELSDAERTALEAGVRSADGFTVRRSEILLASAAGQRPREIAHQLHCGRQTVREAIHAFETGGLACLKRGSSVPLTVTPVLTAEKRERVQAILHQSPRTFGKPSSQWTLKLVAEVCQEQGLSEQRLSEPTILDAIVRLGVRWKRAKHWIVSPDPEYAAKKTARPGNCYGR